MRCGGGEGGWGGCGCVFGVGLNFLFLDFFYLMFNILIFFLFCAFFFPFFPGKEKVIRLPLFQLIASYSGC